MEWEQEQLRRGGHYAETAVEKPQKATYKPAPSKFQSLDGDAPLSDVGVQFLLPPQFPH